MKKRMLSMMLVLAMILTASLTTGVEITFATEYNGWQDGLELSEGDTVVIDGNTYAYGGDAGAGLASSSTGPDVNTIWTAGAGYVLFHYAGEGTSRVVTITLHNATIEKVGADIEGAAFYIPSKYAVKMVLEGENHITSDGTGLDSYSYENTPVFEISGEGSLDIKAREFGLCVNRLTVLKSGTVRVEATGRW